MDYNSYDWLVERLKAPTTFYLEVKIGRDFADAVDRAITALEKLSKENAALKEKIAELEKEKENTPDGLV